jgi:hypothetical protein
MKSKPGTSGSTKVEAGNPRMKLVVSIMQTSTVCWESGIPNGGGARVLVILVCGCVGEAKGQKNHSVVMLNRCCVDSS